MKDAELRNYFWAASMVRAVMRRDVPAIIDLGADEDVMREAVDAAIAELEAIQMHSEWPALSRSAGDILSFADQAVARVIYA